MTDYPTVSILGPEALVAAATAASRVALETPGPFLWEAPERLVEAAIRAALAAVLPSDEVACTEGEECDPTAPGEWWSTCDAHSVARSHAEGEHRWCDIECREAMTTEQLTNFVVAKGYPGTAGALRELLRRAAEDAVKAVCGGTVPPQPPVPEAKPGSEVHVWTDRYAVSSFPFGNPDYHAFLLHVVRRGEGWAVTDGAGWLATEAGAWTIDTYGALIIPSLGEAKRIAVRMAQEVSLRIAKRRPPK